MQSKQQRRSAMAGKMTIGGKLTLFVFLFAVVSVFALIQRHYGLPGVAGFDPMSVVGTTTGKPTSGGDWLKDGRPLLVEGTCFVDFVTDTVWGGKSALEDVINKATRADKAMLDYLPQPVGYARLFPGSAMFSVGDKPSITLPGHLQMKRVAADFGLWVVPSESGPLRDDKLRQRVRDKPPSPITAVQISWAEQRRLLKTREKASPKGCSGDQVAALDKIEIMLLSQLGLHSRQ